MNEEELQPLTAGWISGRQGSRKPKEMCLYVITEAGEDRPCKIGYAVDARQRVLALNTGNYRLLFLRAQFPVKWKLELGEEWIEYVDRVQSIEQQIHKKLAGSHIRGEWFKIYFEDAQQEILKWV